MNDPPDAAASWGSCLYCGDAVPPGATRCPICGAEEPLSPAQERVAPRRSRRRLRALRVLRALIVTVAIVGVAYLVITPIFSGPPVVGDPLTTSGAYTLGPSNTTVLAGEIVGADYLIGNFTVLSPYGLSLGLTVYNTTEYQTYLSGIQSANQTWFAPTSVGRFSFSAPYTDTYYFVFDNPYPTGSGLTVTAYIVTTYTPNVNSFS